MKETTLEEAHHRLFGRPWLLGAFATYEVALHGLHDKDPAILAGVPPPGPPGDFDVVLDLFVIAHLRGGARAEAEKRVKAALRSGGLLARLGIKPVTHTTPAPAFTGTRWGDKLRWNLWRKP